MKIDIKNRFTGEVIFEHEQENNSIKITVEAAVKLNVSLNGASLDGASLDGAYLNRASLDGAYLNRASLDGASLDRASLDGASLDGASLDGASLDGASYGKATLKKGFIQFIGRYWPVLFFDSHIKIGCEFHSTKEWNEFTDDEIKAMDSHALEFWSENKKLILDIAYSHQGAEDEQK